ncbi:angiotensin-converting enzyme [Condylostylus longicornis]|uniref:angiotensin-converting enzyme n=1 Tax=Condylostylus longicornis TaxID=2530218 RepID=UPI00244E040B|nr:angiotensin-converting enzyme [Condylostylus longicornis]
MKLSLCFVCICIMQLTNGAPAESSLNDEEKEALQLINDLNEEMNSLSNRNYVAEWAFASNITDENEKHKNEVQAETAKQTRELVKKLQKFNWREFKNEDLKRQYKLSTKLGYAILDDDDFKDLLENLSKMETNYAKVKICAHLNRTKCDLSLEPHIQTIIVRSRDPEELKYTWTQWYDAAGKPVRKNFEKYIELKTKAAKLSNYTSGAEEWLDEYEDETFEKQVEDVLTDLKPFYEQLHGYVRWRLRQKYGDLHVSEKGPIPIHLLGNIWGQTWGEIANLVAPFPNKPMVNVNAEMKAQGITPLKMFQMGDEFFQSINMTKLPKSFWENSILEKPKDGRELVCHASAWDFYSQDDVRIKQCTEVTQEQLSVVHHELGHIQYFLQYQHLPHVYRSGANPGFHEAVGDVLALSVSTPKHLEKIGLLKDYKPDEEARINQLFLTALDKVAFLPFAYTMDKYRWQILRGELKPEEWNCGFWKLRDQYSGLEPPVKRTEDDFDAPAKYHISADVEYLRYFVSFIIQFQFYKAACVKSGQYEPGNPELPLDNCDFYGSPEAGNAFKEMLSLGASKPWPDAMEVFTGERKMSGAALREYFEPLMNWLKAENEKNKVHIGWEKSDKCG